jgi:hypothetical protein
MAQKDNEEPLARLRSEPSANEGHQSDTGNLLCFECSRNLNSQATLNAIVIDAGIDHVASLGGVRLGRKFAKTARAILYVGHGNRVVDNYRQSTELCPARKRLCGNGRLSAWQDFIICDSKKNHQAERQHNPEGIAQPIDNATHAWVIFPSHALLPPNNTPTWMVQTCLRVLRAR